MVNADGKAAIARDLRRSFAARWAVRVRPPVLQALMRHSILETTLRHYVGLDANDIGDELWKAHDVAESTGPGNTLGNIGQNCPQESETGPGETLPEPVEDFEVT
jgi:hypothetical protein